MSDDENFVARWSRLKRDTAKEKTADETAQPGPQQDDAGSEGPPAVGGQPVEPVFDPASLPSIESITADSDIRAFLQAGVPKELTKAALRRVWTTDPAIRDFIGIAENQWDFTDPNAMPGFGPMEATDDVGELVARAMGKLDQVSEPTMEAALPPQQGVATTSGTIHTPQERDPQVAGMPAENELPPKAGTAGSSVETQNSIVNVAAQHDDAPAREEAMPNRRVHGRALPQ
jgi:hypothetical protein